MHISISGKPNEIAEFILATQNPFEDITITRDIDGKEITTVRKPKITIDGENV